jgi:hypothetical protein
MLIGSVALKHWFPDLGREPADIDHLRRGEVVNGHEVTAFNRILDKYGDLEFAPPDLLYTIKLSHVYWSNKWFDKTTHDLAFMRRKGCKVDEEAYAWLYASWEIVHGKKRAYLAKTNEDFFKDGVKRVYIHDDLHAAVAYYDAPLYTRLKPDLARASCAKDLFMALSPDDRIRCIREEAYVTALERFLIPKEFKTSTYGSYRGALKLLLTSMTRGWFPRYAAEHWEEVSAKTFAPDSALDRLGQGEYSFVKYFNHALNQGSIRHVQPIHSC